MVDIVMQTMPAESEVHVARNFLTKILRSSMRYRIAVGLCLVTPWPCRPETRVSHPLPCAVLPVAVLFTCKMKIKCLSWLSCVIFTGFCRTCERQCSIFSVSFSLVDECWSYFRNKLPVFIVLNWSGFTLPFPPHMHFRKNRFKGYVTCC